MGVLKLIQNTIGTQRGFILYPIEKLTILRDWDELGLSWTNQDSIESNRTTPKLHKGTRESFNIYKR